MDQTTLIAISVVALLLVIGLFFLLRGKKQHIELSAPPPAKPVMRAAPAPAPGPEGNGVTDEAAAAVEDVVGEILEVDAHHDRALDEAAAGPADPLTRIKGLGPKAEARLAQLGITRFEQIAAWTPQEVAEIDAQLGPFKGRIQRDRWVEQATHLAQGDIAGFEAKFGKLSG
ncbi:hypothetical protein CLG96_02665 [Sphingomonas oleivorans]|uniref:LSU ribosomal protein L21p n=1 Tax=Sphingomonas oleivorans TaxID=1735121 RepID=A0A2T5G1S7_9SPHN|nr:hypothetical protein [Sphingomonas oleivorans]PTQ13060.1 hypothetical protein CLG96_02665 [Sphingomonas oleivorans]